MAADAVLLSVDFSFYDIFQSHARVLNSLEKPIGNL